MLALLLCPVVVLSHSRKRVTMASCIRCGEHETRGAGEGQWAKRLPRSIAVLELEKGMTRQYH